MYDGCCDKKNYSSHFFLTYPHPSVNKSTHKNTFTMCHRILNIGNPLRIYKTKITRKKTIPINHPPAETWCGYVVKKNNFIIFNFNKCTNKSWQKQIWFSKKLCVYILSIKKVWSGEEKTELRPIPSPTYVTTFHIHNTT